MKKSRLLGAVCVLLLPLQAISINSVQAAVLTFENVTLNQGEGVFLHELGPFVLHHLDQNHVDVGWHVFNYSLTFPDSLTVSPPNAAGLAGSSYSATQIGIKDSKYSISLNDGGLFNFEGVYFGAQVSGGSGLFIDVNGYKQGQLTYSSTVDDIISGSTATPIWFNADWNDVDRVEIAVGFILHGYLTLDNFTYSVVPIPPFVWLFGSGLLGLVGMARSKKAV
jgi:hypothetical protein